MTAEEILIDYIPEINSENSDYGRIIKAMEEYAEQRIRENYVEKEFVKWVQDDCEFWYDMINKVWVEPEPEDKEYSLDELYDYWIKEIKK